MWKKYVLTTISALVGFLIGFTCGWYYAGSEKPGAVSLRQESNLSQDTEYKIPVTHYPSGSDRETYMIIGTTSESANTIEWGKDKNYAYYNGYPIKDADVQTFVAVRNEKSEMVCAKDKTHVWFYADVFESNKQISDSHIIADSNTVVATGYYCKDNAHVWMGANELEEADALTFKAYKENGSFAQDKNYIWADSNIIEEADKETFRVLEEPYFDSTKNMYIFAEDKNQKYNDRGRTTPLVQ